MVPAEWFAWVVSEYGQGCMEEAREGSVQREKKFLDAKIGFRRKKNPVDKIKCEVRGRECRRRLPDRSQQARGVCVSACVEEY